jgi:hypothetical protein
MTTLLTQDGFYEKTSPKTTKMPGFPPKRGKNTEKAIEKTHFPNEP